jgi:hypothetical protein
MGPMQWTFAVNRWPPEEELSVELGSERAR